jgi:hypothetical protein
MSFATWYACSAAARGLALTRPTGQMYMAELDDAMLPSATCLGGHPLRSFLVVGGTDGRNRSRLAIISS